MLAGCDDSKRRSRCGDREGLPRWKRTRKMFRYDHMGRQEESKKETAKNKKRKKRKSRGDLLPIFPYPFKKKVFPWV